MTIQNAKGARRPLICGTLSVAAPLVGAFLGYVLISIGVLWGLGLILLSPICGIGFALSALICRERYWWLPSIGLLLNAALALWLVLWMASSPVWPTADSFLEVFYRHSNPVKAWKGASQKPNPIIDKDYHDFINKLSLSPGEFIGGQGFLEDGTGQHAVTIEVGRDGTYWTYVLIYDQNNTRIKAIKYISGHYAC